MLKTLLWLGIIMDGCILVSIIALISLIIYLTYWCD